jgi:hypothetical protein
MEHSCSGDGRQTAGGAARDHTLVRVAVLWTNCADGAEQLRETDRGAHALGIAMFQAVVQEHANALL